MVSQAPVGKCVHTRVCVCFSALLCPDHLVTMCHEQAGERSPSAVISSYRNVRNSVCGVGVGVGRIGPKGFGHTQTEPHNILHLWGHLTERVKTEIIVHPIQTLVKKFRF